MAVRVLVVDDSVFFRNRISDLLSGDSRIEVVGVAQNGLEGIEQAKKLRPDLITMDVEMPQMNGIDAVKGIMRESPTSIIMLSSLTHEGAQVTLQALEAGALDYISKDMRAWMDHSASLEKQLRDKVVELAGSHKSRWRHQETGAPSGKSMVFRPTETASAPRDAKTAKPAPEVTYRAPLSAKYHVPATTKIVVIGSSTGGPAALQQILTQLPANIPYPILLVQHMPKTFTSVFASRLDQQCNISIKEAENGDQLKPGCALLAPGGCQMIIDPNRNGFIKVMPSDERLTYKPSVDVTYASVAKSYGKNSLAVILTGMGADGCDGAKILRQKGATIWAQNEESCTIYGMPQAIINAGLADEILDLSEFGASLASRR